MSAFLHTEFTLRCDQPDCRARFWLRGVSRAALRRLAVKTGWTHVRHGIGPKYDEDFCPRHKPAGTEN